MKKVYLLLCALVVTSVSFAQTIDNAGMETWRSGSAGGANSTAVTIHAPTSWYSFDSLAIGLLDQLGGLLFMGYQPTDFRAQIFQENTIKHGGNSSAKVISVKQDTIGIIPGTLANAVPGINIAAAQSGDIANAITFSGGTPTALRITTVSAYLEYVPGRDSVTHSYVNTNDSGTIRVQAMAQVGGISTMVGSGTLTVGRTASFTQYTVNVNYTDTTHMIDTVRIVFSSSRGFNDLDSSIMYVDDVTMTGVPQINAVHNVAAKANVVNVYPNPASGIIHLDGAQSAGMLCELVSASGQVVATKTLTGADVLDISSLAAGNYFYIISDGKGNAVQRGNVSKAN